MKLCAAVHKPVSSETDADWTLSTVGSYPLTEGINHTAQFPFLRLRLEATDYHGCALLLERPVVVLRRPLHQVHLGARDAAYGPVPVVPDTHVKVPGVKVLKVLVEGHKVLHEEAESTALS